MPRQQTSPQIDAPRQSNQKILLLAAINAAIITTAATPDSHPVCRPLLIQFVALHNDIIGDQARASRHAFLERIADSGILIMPMHFGAPHCGYIRRGGPDGTYVFVPEDRPQFAA
jgi:hypothetical protein